MLCLLISRVLVIVLILPVATSTLSNPLVGFILLVDLMLILFSLDRSLRKNTVLLPEPLLSLRVASWYSVGGVYGGQESNHQEFS